MKRALYVLIGLVILAGVVVGGFIIYTLIIDESDPSGETVAPTLEAGNDNQQVYRISASDSIVSFQLEEDLRGQRNVVTGETQEVAGDILVDFDNPAMSEVGTIRINARTLATDNDFRNRAIRTQILQSARDEYEFIEFEPTEIRNFPADPQIGQELTFDVVGNLTIRETTREETFQATVTLVNEDLMEGMATAQVLRENYGLQIPSAPGVANVTDEVQLTINFVALAVDDMPAEESATPAP
jgi:polyisoprenoid-binding protein YceI